MPIPSRSRLDHLEPRGIGTAQVESLTSYETRLANTHNLSTAVLHVQEINSQITKARTAGGPMPDSSNCSLTTFFLFAAKSMNGTGSIATDYVRALENLTMRTELRFLTMLTWANVVAQTHLLRPVRAWCPSCYEEWRDNGNIIYEQLLWALEVVEICPHHHRRLTSWCPHCKRQLPLLKAFSRPGYCSRCGNWLGSPPDFKSDCGDVISEEELKWQKWVTKSVGEMIAAAPFISVPPARERFANSISAYIDHFSNGSIRAFSFSFKVPRETLRLWRAGKTIPQFSALLRLCRLLGTTPLHLLMSADNSVDPSNPATPIPLEAKPRKIGRPGRKIDWGEVERKLLEVLNNEMPPPPMASVARRLGIDTRHLYRHQHELCCAIAARHVRYKNSVWQTVQRQLKKALEVQSPPPSMEELAKQLGYFISTLYKKFPKLCRAISVRYAEHQNILCLERRKLLKDQVRKAVLTLHAQGEYPSFRRVSALLDKPRSIKNRVALAAFREVREELGLVNRPN